MHEQNSGLLTRSQKLAAVREIVFPTVRGAPVVVGGVQWIVVFVGRGTARPLVFLLGCLERCWLVHCCC